MANNPYNLKYTGEQIDDLLDVVNDLDLASSEEPGLMSANDKAKLDEIESGAQENVVESVSLNGTALTPDENKNINIPMDSEPASGSNNPVKSGGVYSAIRTVESDVGYIEARISPEAEPNDKLLAASEISRAIATALANYYTKNQTYSQEEVNALVAGMKQFTYTVADSLPTASADTMYILYLIPSTNPKTSNSKDEFITVRSGSEGSYTYAWEQIGSTTFTLVTISNEEIDALFA